MGRNNTETNVQIFRNNPKHEAKIKIIYTKNTAKNNEIYYGIKLLGKFGLRPEYGFYKENL
jgi:hypothetical protein